MSVTAAPSLLRLSPSSPADRRLLDEVVARLRAKDDVVIDRVLRELFPEVRRWMLRHLGPHEELEDAIQEALTEIASALHRFEGRSSLATLSHRIALRTAYRYYRANRRPPPVEPPPEHENVERRVRARRALHRLHAALAELPARRRTAFVLCSVEGLDPREACEIMDVSPNAMRSLLCRARQQLQAIVADDDELGDRR